MLAVLAAGGSASQRDQGLELGVTRFFLPASGETQVLTQAGVPYLFASAIGSGADAHVTYTVTVKVVDDRGTVLTSESFQRSAPAMARIPGAAGVENFRFLLKPGTFVMHGRPGLVDREDDCRFGAPRGLCLGARCVGFDARERNAAVAGG
jgi:hypothetical protein